MFAYWAPGWDVPETDINRIKEDFSRPGRLQAAIGYYTSFFGDVSNQEHLALYNQPTSVPTLAFGGEQDGPIDIEVFEVMGGAFTDDYQFVRVPIAGHFVHQEAHNLFIEELLTFLELEVSS